MSLSANWIKCQSGNWCSFLTVNLEHHHFVSMNGVYIVWHGGQDARVVVVGNGHIATQLRQQRSNPKVLGYVTHGLFVTWARVSEGHQAGAVNFLNERYSPLISTRVPGVREPVTVDTPW